MTEWDPTRFKYKDVFCFLKETDSLWSQLIQARFPGMDWLKARTFLVADRLWIEIRLQQTPMNYMESFDICSMFIEAVAKQLWHCDHVFPPGLKVELAFVYIPNPDQAKHRVDTYSSFVHMLELAYHQKENFEFPDVTEYIAKFSTQEL